MSRTTLVAAMAFAMVALTPLNAVASDRTADGPAVTEEKAPPERPADVTPTDEVPPTEVAPSTDVKPVDVRPTDVRPSDHPCTGLSGAELFKCRCDAAGLTIDVCRCLADTDLNTDQCRCRVAGIDLDLCRCRIAAADGLVDYDLCRCRIAAADGGIDFDLCRCRVAAADGLVDYDLCRCKVLGLDDAICRCLAADVDPEACRCRLFEHTHGYTHRRCVDADRPVVYVLRQYLATLL